MTAALPKSETASRTASVSRREPRQVLPRVVSVLGRSFRTWWRNLFVLTFFNIVWLALQLPVVTGPLATAAMYVVARRLLDGELTGPRYGWEALRQVAVPAARWGAVNAVVVLAVVSNFWAYRDNVGVEWTVIRLAWAVIGLGWYVVNFYYWPFWLAQQDRSMRTTLRNSLLFVARRPALGLGVALASLIIIVMSILVTLPFAAALMAWIALIGLTTVDAEFEATFGGPLSNGRA